MLPDSSFLNRLANNNERPMDSTIAEVRKLLSAPLKQLEEIKLEIKRLEAKQFEIEESVQDSLRILAPIRRVPQDILCIIFEQCLPAHRNPTMSATEAPMLLTRVCSTWRSIAMEHPRLWAQIHIPFRKYTDDQHDVERRYDDPLVPQHLVTTVLQTRCYAVQQWLSRSGDLPLSISVRHYASRRFTNDLEPPPIDKLTKTLVDILLLLSPRWRSLEITIPDDMYYELEEMLSTHTLPLLRRLRISVFSSSDWGMRSRPSPPESLLRAPKLKYVSLNFPKVTDLLSLSLPNSLTGWNTGITHVSLSRCGLKSCVALFQSHPRLIRCNIFVGSDDWQAENQIVIPNDIYLPHLLSLWVHNDGKSGVLNFVPALFNKIRAPQLQNFAYYNTNGSFGDTLAQVTTDELPLPFFHRAINLTSLEIDRCFLMPSNIRDILGSQHRLTRLALTSKYNITSCRFASLEMETFDLESLVVRGDVDKELNPVNSTSVQLLPCLEVFELHKAIVTDEQVLRFVSSRMNPRSHIAVLKKVKIIFDRLKEHDGCLDLVEEIQRCADAAAVEIDAKFRYALSISDVKKERNFLSPSYQVLDDGFEDKPTWIYEEHFDQYDD